MNDLISVVTTVKNGERYLEETMRSVYNQTYTNYEHIIIDDGSTDNTWKIVQNFQNNHQNHQVKAIQTEGVGRAKALNMGVENAKGDWIAIIDADDLWHPRKLELQMNCLLENPNIDVLGTQTKLFTKTEELDFKDIEKKKGVDMISKKQILRSCSLNHSSALIRKSCCIYDESRDSQIDYELWLRLITQGKKLAKLDNELSTHRVHKGQSFESKQGKKFRWKGFKLTLPYILKNKAYRILFIKTMKLLIGTILPMSTVRRLRKRN